VSVSPSRLAIATVALLGAVNLVRGAIHLFAPDGGAASIAGLELAGAPQTILFLFATLGVGQIALGLADAAAAWRWHGFVVPLLFIHVVQAGLGVFVLFLFKPPPTPVPGQWFNLAVLVAVVAVALIEMLRLRRHAG